MKTTRFVQHVMVGGIACLLAWFIGLFEMSALIMPPVLASVLLLFCANLLTFGPRAFDQVQASRLVAVVLGTAVGLVGAGETSGVFVQPVLTAAQQGGSMLATGFVAWGIFQIMAENEPSFAAALDAKVVIAAGAAAGWFMLTGTWVSALLLVILFTGHRLFQSSGRGLVNLNGILIVSTEVFLLLNWFFAVFLV